MSEVQCPEQIRADRFELFLQVLDLFIWDNVPQGKNKGVTSCHGLPRDVVKQILFERCGFTDEAFEYLGYMHLSNNQSFGRLSKCQRNNYVQGHLHALSTLADDPKSIFFDPSLFLKRFLWYTQPPCSQPLGQAMVRLLNLITCGELTKQDLQG